MSNTDPAPAPPAPEPPELPSLRLWRTLLGFIEAAFSLFGAPATLANKLWLTRAEHRRASDWLAMLEALLRRLLYLDAFTLRPTPPCAEQKARAPRTLSTRFGAAFDPDRPESWRTCFVLRPGPGGCAPRRGAPHLRAQMPSAPLSLRLEAIVRAFNAREQHAQRFADLLHRLGRRALAMVRTLATPVRLRYPPGRRCVREASWICAALGPPLTLNAS